MSAQVSALSDAAGIALAGRVDYLSAEPCLQQGLKLLAALPVEARLVCDLSGLDTGSSVTAAVLMTWQRAAGSRRQHLTLQAVPQRLRAILAASNLLDVLAPQS